LRLRDQVASDFTDPVKQRETGILRIRIGFNGGKAIRVHCCRERSGVLPARIALLLVDRLIAAKFPGLPK
jgi:hypothetical protein